MDDHPADSCAISRYVFLVKTDRVLVTVKHLTYVINYCLALLSEIFEVCDLLQCDTRLLVSALKQRTVDTGGEKVRTDLSASEVSQIKMKIASYKYQNVHLAFSEQIESVNIKIK